MSVFVFVLGVLAVWRVTHLVVAEDGPFDLIANLRRAAGACVLGKLLDCFYCLSLWVSLPFALWMEHSWGRRALAWLALSGGAILVNRVANRIAPEAPVYFEEPEPLATHDQVQGKEQK